MRRSLNLAALLLTIAAFLGTTGCSGDSPTDPGNVPVISQLQVQGAQRVSGSVGLVGFSFEYADPDADIDRFVFSVASGSLVTNPLSDAQRPSGRAGVQQSVDMPAAGVEVTFSVFVLDRRGNRSNTLSGTFVAP